MQIGDEVLFYQSQEGNCIMGRMNVSKEAHQDPTTADERWVSVTFEPVETFKNPISLSQIKATKGLENVGLIKQQRLSVMPLKKEEFENILNKKSTP